MKMIPSEMRLRARKPCSVAVRPATDLYTCSRVGPGIIDWRAGRTGSQELCGVHGVAKGHRGVYKAQEAL